MLFYPSSWTVQSKVLALGSPRATGLPTPATKYSTISCLREFERLLLEKTHSIDCRSVRPPEWCYEYIIIVSISISPAGEGNRKRKIAAVLHTHTHRHRCTDSLSVSEYYWTAAVGATTFWRRPQRRPRDAAIRVCILRDAKRNYILIRHTPRARSYIGYAVAFCI